MLITEFILGFIVGVCSYALVIECIRAYMRRR